MKSKTIFWHPLNFSLAYRDNNELSALQATDCNIDDLIVGFTKQVEQVGSSTATLTN